MAQQDRQNQGSQQKDKKSGSKSGEQRQGTNRQDDATRDRKDSE